MPPRMRVKRQFLGKSQTELAQEVGTRQATISAFENRQLLPGIELAKKLGQALGLRPEELLQEVALTLQQVTEMIKAGYFADEGDFSAHDIPRARTLEELEELVKEAKE